MVAACYHLSRFAALPVGNRDSPIGLSVTQPQATEIRLRAERRAGELLKGMADKGERRQSSDPSSTVLPALSERRAGELLANMRETGAREAGGRPLENPTSHGRVKLADLDISENQSSRWQKWPRWMKTLFLGHE
jgi:hypothetical protein